jgi:SAM-dependent methyltransferase
MSNDYTREADGVWHRAGFSGITYTDGSDIEQRLLDAVSSASCLDTFSSELLGRIVDWPSEYHLSRSRHCLLRPLGIKAGDRVLELGCGCGAITRYLGEMGADVVAVEGTPARARIAAARCRDLGNVRVFCDDLVAFEAEELFDWVLLVGVLEYATMFSTMPDPVGQFLKAAGRWLAPKCRLVIAIENKLGLKYFNGCAEDHVGKAFFGIEGLYQRDTPVTFGRKELGAVLDAADFSVQHWYYPFPDYKLPAVVLNSSALACPEFNVADLLLHTQSRDYSGEPHRLFDETLAMVSLTRNGLIADLSNSFLVVAKRDAAAAAPAEPLAWSFAVHRRACFATETTFLRRETGIMVVKTAIGPPQGSQAKGDAVQRVNRRCGEATYRTGTLLARRVVEASARELSCACMAAQFLPWFDDLLRRAVLAPRGAPEAVSGRRKLGDYEIDGRFIDCVPFNMVEAADAVYLIDDEWSISGRIPLGHVICRGLIYSLRLCLNRTQLYGLAEILQHLCAARDLTIDNADIDTWLGLESTFQEEVTGRRPDRQAVSSTSGSLVSLLSALRQRQARYNALQDEVLGARKSYGEAIRLQEAALTEANVRCDALRAELERVREDCREIMSSASWRATAPLRAVKAGLKTLAGGRRSADGGR